MTFTGKVNEQPLIVEWQDESPMALAVLAAWAVVLICIIGPSKRQYGEEDVAGSPRWAAIVSLHGAWLLNVIFALSCYEHGNQTGSWLLAQGSSADSTLYEIIFGYLFAAMICKDYFLFGLSPLVHLHHIACILGHFGVIVMLPKSVPVFFGGVAALEFGTSFYNLRLAHRSSQVLLLAYTVCMSISNTLAFICGMMGVMQIESYGGKVFYFAVTTILVLMRQKEVFSERALSTADKKD